MYIFLAYSNERDYENNNPFHTKELDTHEEMVEYSNEHAALNDHNPEYCSTYYDKLEKQ